MGNSRNGGSRRFHDQAHHRREDGSRLRETSDRRRLGEQFRPGGETGRRAVDRGLYLSSGGEPSHRVSKSRTAEPGRLLRFKSEELQILFCEVRQLEVQVLKSGTVTTIPKLPTDRSPQSTLPSLGIVMTVPDFLRGFYETHGRRFLRRCDPGSRASAAAPPSRRGTG